MGDKFYPDRFLKQVMPKSFYSQNLVDKDFDLKKNALKAINRARTITGRPIDTTVYNVLSQYEQKYKGLIADGESSTQAFNEAVNNSALLRQRIEQTVVYDEIQNLKTQHTGEFYRWLPSGAANPDPEHQLLYGKIFRVGDGDKNGNMPGERYGCQCGIEWLSGNEMTPDEKIEAVKIDFRKNSYLPHLNAKQLEIIGINDKDVIFKRTTGQRNKLVHKEVSRKMYEPLIGQALYQPILPPLQDLKNKQYWHFIGEAANHKKAFVLLDMEKEKKAFEIVHVLRMKEKNYRQFLKKYLKRQ